MADDTTPQPQPEGGWATAFANHLKQAAHDAIDNLHDRLTYGTQANKDAISEAAKEDPDATSDKDSSQTGFQKAK